MSEAVEHYERLVREMPTSGLYRQLRALHIGDGENIIPTERMYLVMDEIDRRSGSHDPHLEWLDQEIAKADATESGSDDGHEKIHKRDN